MTYTLALKEKVEAEGLPIYFDSHQLYFDSHQLYFDSHQHMAHIFSIYPISEADDALDIMAEFVAKVREPTPRKETQSFFGGSNPILV